MLRNMVLYVVSCGGVCGVVRMLMCLVVSICSLMVYLVFQNCGDVCLCFVILYCGVCYCVVM